MVDTAWLLSSEARSLRATSWRLPPRCASPAAAVVGVAARVVSVAPAVVSEAPTVVSAAPTVVSDGVADRCSPHRSYRWSPSRCMPPRPATTPTPNRSCAWSLLPGSSKAATIHSGPHGHPGDGRARRPGNRGACGGPAGCGVDLWYRVRPMHRCARRPGHHPLRGIARFPTERHPRAHQRGRSRPAR